MKRSKLITSLCSLSVVTTAIPVTITGCNSSSNATPSIVVPGSDDHYIWTTTPNNLLTLDFSSSAGGSSGANISVKVKLNPIPTSIVKDLKICKDDGSPTTVDAAVESNGIYTFTVKMDDLENGNYKITGTNVNELKFAVAINVDATAEAIIPANCKFGEIDGGTTGKKLIKGQELTGLIAVGDKLEIRIKDEAPKSANTTVFNVGSSTLIEGANNDYTASVNGDVVTIEILKLDNFAPTSACTITVNTKDEQKPQVSFNTPAVVVGGKSTKGFGGKKIINNGDELAQKPSDNDVLDLTIDKCYKISDIDVSRTLFTNDNMPLDYVSENPGDNEFTATIIENVVTITLGTSMSTCFGYGQDCVIKLKDENADDIAVFNFTTPAAVSITETKAGKNGFAEITSGNPVSTINNVIKVEDELVLKLNDPKKYVAAPTTIVSKTSAPTLTEGEDFVCDYTTSGQVTITFKKVDNLQNDIEYIITLNAVSNPTTSFTTGNTSMVAKTAGTQGFCGIATGTIVNEGYPWTKTVRDNDALEFTLDLNKTYSMFPSQDELSRTNVYIAGIEGGEYGSQFTAAVEVDESGRIYKLTLTFIDTKEYVTTTMGRYDINFILKNGQRISFSWTNNV